MKLLDYCDINPKKLDFFEGKKKYIATGDFNNGEITSYTEVTFEKRPSRANIKIDEKDILFAKMKSTKKVIYGNVENIDYIYSTGFYCITAKENVNPKILYYFLLSNSFNKQKDKNCSGSTMKAINDKGLENIKLILPVLSKQNIIVNNLEKIESLIRNRKESLNDLNNLIKSKYNEMFKDIYNDDNFNKTMGEVCEKVKRYPTFCNMKYLDSGIRVIRIGNILKDGSMDLNDDNYVFVYSKANDDFPETVLEENDIVMAVRGDGSTAKKIGLIRDKKLCGSNISPNLIRIKSDKKIINPIYLFYFLTSEVGQKRLERYINKTAKKNLSAKDILKVKIPCPDLEKQTSFINYIKKMEQAKQLITSDIEDLEKLFTIRLEEYFSNLEDSH